MTAPSIAELLTQPMPDDLSELDALTCHCAECHAEPGEPCRPTCTGYASHLDDLEDNDDDRTYPTT